MNSEVLAEQIYSETVGKLSKFEKSGFFLANPDVAKLSQGFTAVIEFLLKRPAMLVHDVMQKDQLLIYLDQEVDEAMKAKKDETEWDHFLELGDVGFFGLLIGSLFWDELSDEQREKITTTIKWAREESESRSFDLNNAVQWVALVKDSANYREEFHQLIESETVDEVALRVPRIRDLHKELRPKLNGEWAGSHDLIMTLAIQWLSLGIGSNTMDNTRQLIEQMFKYAGLNLEDQVEKLASQ